MCPLNGGGDVCASACVRGVLVGWTEDIPFSGLGGKLLATQLGAGRLALRLIRLVRRE